uniref:Domain X domain-containing protein n=1 Tax=Trachelomonas volvocina TaxID=103340 RepID=A0A0G3VSH7_9EUGL|nr:hypothetical protein [Trachelomonas volvocina]AKL82464.1 hypothetical protein [Trachelomonas volvocina]
MFIIVRINYVFFFMFFGFYNNLGRRMVKCSSCYLVDFWNLKDPVLKNWKSLSLSPRTFNLSSKFIKLKYDCFVNRVSIIDRVYEILLDPDFIYFSYTQLTSFSKGVRGLFALSNLEYEIVINTINSLKFFSFDFNVKNNDMSNNFYLVYLKNKIIEKSVFFILEAIYEPIFFQNNFGFRSLFNAHDCLYYISREFNNMNWFISGTIKSCFFELDQTIVIGNLKKRVRDKQFLNLVSQFLRAGYVNNMKSIKDSFVGNVNGSILSNIFLNVFLHEFDSYVVEILLNSYYCNIYRESDNYVICKRLRSELFYNIRKYSLTKSKFYFEKFSYMKFTIIKHQRFHDYKRISYVRYVDDWFISLAGSYTDSLKLRDLCISFFVKLKCRLSLITFSVVPSYRGCFFIGFHISVVKKVKYLNKKQDFYQLSFNVPIKRVLDKLVLNKLLLNVNNEVYKSIPYFKWYSYSRLELLNSYNSIYNLFVRFYSPANNIKRFRVLLWYLLRSSMAKLVAAKYKLKSSAAVFKKYGRFFERFVIRNDFNYGSKFIDWHEEILFEPKFKFAKSLSTRFLDF